MFYFIFFFNEESYIYIFFFFQAEDGIRDRNVTGVQTCALPIFLFRMAEAAIAEAVELCRDRRRGLVPLHATIDTRIVQAALFFMTIGAKFTRPIAPSAARLRATYAPQI